jgi:hypothetical protein
VEIEMKVKVGTHKSSTEKTFNLEKTVNAKSKEASFDSSMK